ncbi:uncharacterized protein J3R85_012229 [Psidium guajava]|nr:uncharacterized protein J3R85_012229 [Psidium guajava]
MNIWTQFCVDPCSGPLGCWPSAPFCLLLWSCLFCLAGVLGFLVLLSRRFRCVLLLGPAALPGCPHRLFDALTSVHYFAILVDPIWRVIESVMAAVLLGAVHGHGSDAAMFRRGLLLLQSPPLLVHFYSWKVGARRDCLWPCCWLLQPNLLALNASLRMQP